jgi:hypothetical protein
MDNYLSNLHPQRLLVKLVMYAVSAAGDPDGSHHPQTNPCKPTDVFIAR